MTHWVVLYMYGSLFYGYLYQLPCIAVYTNDVIACVVRTNMQLACYIVRINLIRYLVYIVSVLCHLSQIRLNDLLCNFDHFTSRFKVYYNFIRFYGGKLLFLYCHWGVRNLMILVFYIYVDTSVFNLVQPPDYEVVTKLM